MRLRVSHRKKYSLTQAGEYFDGRDIMSAMNVDSDTGHHLSRADRFSM